MKTIRYLTLSLALLALLAMPVLAETPVTTTALAAADQTVEYVTDPLAQTEPAPVAPSTTLSREELTREVETQTYALPSLLAFDETTAVPPLDYLQQNVLSLAALALGGLALVLSIAALAKSGHKNGRRRSKNYF